MRAVAPTPRKAAPVNADRLARQLAQATDPAAIRRIEAEVEAIEHAMKQSGLYSTAEIRPVNELRMRARWKLGKALSKVERKQGGSKYRADTLKKLLTELRLDKMRALEAQRIGAMPDAELERALTEAHRQDILCTFAELIDRARPYWYQASRKAKHRTINANAAAASLPEGVGPFPLIYADPPWKFEVYSDKGLERTPDQHYPTLADSEIVNYRVDGKGVADLAHKAAALLLWCTSSNVERALLVMKAWGFTYKAQAVWVKDRAGLGLVFRNQHEVLLYGTRGAMPGPQYQPPSVFHFPRDRHSAKPAEIRSAIERMYPDFDERTRLELFARDQVPGWTCHGFEANRAVA